MRCWKKPRQEKELITILPLGGAGTGKSTICNALAGTADVNFFGSSDSVMGAATTKVICHTFKLFGRGPQEVRLIDVPGSADITFTTNEWIDMIKSKLAGVGVDLIVLTINGMVPRTDYPQVAVLEKIQQFVENLQPNHVWVCFTRADQPGFLGNNPKWVDSKLDALQKIADSDVINLSPNKVVLFNGSGSKQAERSLKGMLESLDSGHQQCVLTADIEGAKFRYNNCIERKMAANKEFAEEKENIMRMHEKLLKQEQDKLAAVMRELEMSAEEVEKVKATTQSSILEMRKMNETLSTKLKKEAMLNEQARTRDEEITHFLSRTVRSIEDFFRNIFSG